MKIPFYKPSIGPEEIDEVVQTLKGGWLTTGPRTKQFEKEFADYVRQQHAVAVNSCTAALHLALESIGLKAGQGVIVPTMTFAATAEVVRYLSGRPILADCRVEDFNLDVADAERKINEWQTTGPREGNKKAESRKLKAEMGPGRRRKGEVVAIIPVHYGGQVGDVAGVQELARRYNLKIVEDAAHCCPAFYRESRKQKVESRNTSENAEKLRADMLTSEVRGQKTEDGGREGQAEKLKPEMLKGPTLNSQLSTLNYAADGWKPVGASADISCYSFYANKTITTGEGGMACTNHDEYADRMRIMSLHGISKDAWKRFTAEGSWYYEIIAPGYKYNLTDIASAIGIHQLRKANLFHQRRTDIVEAYNNALKDIEELTLPQAMPDRIHSWHLFVIRLKLDRLKIDRAQLITELQQRGIGASVHWLPLHMHPYYRETYGYAPQDLPTAAALYPEIVTLPLYPDMGEGDVAYVCDSIKEIVVANLRGQKMVRPKAESKKQKVES